MKFESSYQSKIPNADGEFEFSPEEHRVWQTLFTRQRLLQKDRACDEYLKGLTLLNLTADTIPPLKKTADILNSISQWAVAPVPALIPARDFFELLAQRRFPAATFIRRMEEIDYVKEPDIFHELFGHCPMLTDRVFADFVHEYAVMVLSHPEEDWLLLQRFFWYTVEFGLIKTPIGMRIYGGGILSSTNETVYSVEDSKPQRYPFDPIQILRTPYRIDMLQTVYFYIDSYQQLYDVLTLDMNELLKQARVLGELPPTFPVDKNNPSMHINAC